MNKMKKYATAVIMGIALLLSGAAFTGCNTTGQISPAIINGAAAIVKEGAYQGAAYAIQNNTNNFKYFILADSAIKTFATGQNLTPTAFETALISIDPALQNQWVQFGIDLTLTVYDAAYGHYVIGQVNSNAVARLFVSAIIEGFDRALGPYVTNTVSLKLMAHPAVITRPSIIKIVNSLQPSK